MARFDSLWEGYLRDELSDEALQELLGLLETDADQLGDGMEEALRQDRFAGMTDAAQRMLMLSRVLEQTRSMEAGREGRKAGRAVLMRRLAAAAVILVIMGSIGLWAVLRGRSGGELRQEQVAKNDVGPGGDKAMLTLADGSSIDLSRAQNGELARQGQANVVKKADGKLAYEDRGAPVPGAGGGPVTYNTITTPRGGRYELTLPDGSRVILNSASSLRYPTEFTGRERTVALTGEGYFEIARDKARPFKVMADGTEVKVLGTHFDIMAYGDEAAIHTTLVEGSVEVQEKVQERVLQPGQEAIVGRDAAGIAVREADIDKALAWTMGFFKFDHSDFPSMMREIARWYDVGIVYETTNFNNGTYSGRIRRNLNLSVLIRFLESIGVHHFRIEGKQLIVLP